MVKKKTHIDFCHELKAQNLKVTVLGTYKDYNSKIDVRCDKCGCDGRRVQEVYCTDMAVPGVPESN